MVPCRYCGREYSPHVVKKHTSSCLSNEEFASLIRLEIQKACPLGVLISWRAYRSLSFSSSFPLPAPGYLLRELGSWDAVAKWAGLLPSSQIDEVTWKRAREFIADLAHELHEGDFGPSITEYDALRPEFLPASDALIKRLSTWAAVLLWGGGFQEGDVGYYIFRQFEREIRVMNEARAKFDARQRLSSVERILARQAEPTGGMTINGEPKEGVLYDWYMRGYYKCTKTELR